MLGQIDPGILIPQSPNARQLLNKLQQALPVTGT